MKMVAGDQSFYNNYTLEMIRFFEEFDRYTGKKYHEILRRKIDSDYYGYCTSIEQDEGVRKALEKRNWTLNELRNITKKKFLPHMLVQILYKITGKII